MNNTKAQDELIAFMLKPMKDAIKEREGLHKKELRLFKKYQKEYLR